MLETYKVLPTYSICTIYNRIIDKKNNRKYQTQKKRNTQNFQDVLQSESDLPNDSNKGLNDNNKKEINKSQFRKRTIKSKYDDSEISDNYEFMKTYPCVECLEKIYLLDICKNFKDMSKDLEWASCQNQNCNAKILPKLRIKYIFEENNSKNNNNSNNNTIRYSDRARKFSTSTSSLSEHHNCHESEVLNSPFHLKYNFYNSSFIESRLKLDVDYFKIKFNAIFWNSVWYFKLKNLPEDFIFPYQEDKSVNTVNSSGKTLTPDIEKILHNKDLLKSNNNLDNYNKEKELILRDSIKSKKNYNLNLNDKDSNPFSFGTNNNDSNNRIKININEIPNDNYNSEKIIIIENENEKENSNLKNVINENENENNNINNNNKDLTHEKIRNEKVSNNFIENLNKNKKFNSTENLEISEENNFSSLRTFENLENSEFDMEINKEITEENYIEKIKGVSFYNNSVVITSSNLGSNYIKELSQINENEEKDDLNTYKKLKINMDIKENELKNLGKDKEIEKDKDRNINPNINIYQNIINNNHSEKDKKHCENNAKYISSEKYDNHLEIKENKDIDSNNNSYNNNIKGKGSHKNQRSYDFTQFNKININNFNNDISEAFEYNKEHNSSIKEPYKFIITPKGKRDFFPLDKNNFRKYESMNNLDINKNRNFNQLPNRNSLYVNNDPNLNSNCNSNSNEEKINISNKKLQTININSFEVKKHFQSKSEINVFLVKNENKNKENSNDFNTNTERNLYSKNDILQNFDLNLNSSKNKNKIVMSLTPKKNNNQNLTLENFFKKDNNNNTIDKIKIADNENNNENSNKNQNDNKEEKNILNKIQKEKLIFETNFNNNINNTNFSSNRINKLYDFPPQNKSNSIIVKSNLNHFNSYSEINLSKNDVNNNLNNNVDLNENKINNEYNDLKAEKKNTIENHLNKRFSFNHSNTFTMRPINLNLKNSKMNINLDDSSNSIEEVNDENLNFNKKCLTSRNSIASNYAKINGSSMNLLLNNNYNPNNNNNIIRNTFNTNNPFNNFNQSNSIERSNLKKNHHKFSLDNIKANINTSFNNNNNQLNRKYNDINNNNKNVLKTNNKNENLKKYFKLETFDNNSSLYKGDFNRNINNNYNKNKNEEIDGNFFSLDKDDLINDNINYLEYNTNLNNNINNNNNKIKNILNKSDSRKSSYNKILKPIKEEEEIREREFNSNFVLQDNNINNEKTNNYKIDQIQKQDNNNNNTIKKSKNEIGSESLSGIHLKMNLDNNKNYMRYSSFNIKDILTDKDKIEYLNLNSRYYTQEPEEYLYSIKEDNDNELSRITSKSDKIVDIFSSNKKKRKSDLDFNNNNGNRTPK
jgi:hypothetical protein